MHRRSPFGLAIVAAAAALAVSGCGTFTTDVVARVGSVELTEDQLASLLRESLGDDAERAPLEAANSAITGFVIGESLRADLERLGVSVPRPPTDEATDGLTNATIDESFSLALEAWQSTPPQQFTRSDWSESYEAGPIESGITCTAHILLETEADATNALALVDAGTPFSEVAAALSIDEQSPGGVIPCSGTAAFANNFVAEYVDAALSAEIGVPVGPVESSFGYHIIVVRSFDDLRLDELEQLLVEPAVRFDLASRDLDIYINPRYGSFEGSRGSVSLG